MLQTEGDDAGVSPVTSRNPLPALAWSQNRKNLVSVSRQVSGVLHGGRAGEARTVHVQNDKGCFYTCRGLFNHLPLQTRGSEAHGLPAAFAPAAQDKLPFRKDKEKQICAGIKHDRDIHKIKTNNYLKTRRLLGSGSGLFTTRRKSEHPRMNWSKLNRTITHTNLQCNIIFIHELFISNV